MDHFNWTQFIIILAGAIFGAIAIMPYAFTLNKDKLAEAPLSIPQLAMVSLLQGTIIFAIVTFLGLNATHTLGLNIPSSLASIPLAIVAGILGSSLLVLLEIAIFQANLPPAMQNVTHTLPLWKRFLTAFYGGISEEVLTRLFLVSGIAWIIVQVTQTTTSSAVPIAIVLSAIIFGIGHLPATAAMARLTPLLIVRAIVLNGIIGIVCGVLFWQYGLVAAMIAHFSADIILHVVAPPLMHKLNGQTQMTSIQPV